jgi:hypothetical protein
MKTYPILGCCVMWMTALAQGITLDQAKITYLQNDVAVGDVQLLNPAAGEGSKVPASLNQTVTKDNVVITGDRSRAEMKFNDASVARLGQFTVFSFKEGTRDIDLKRGSALLHVPKGMGRTQITTAALSAAITGTTVLFQTFEAYTAIYVYEGTVEAGGRVIGSGQVMFIQDGKIWVEAFDVKTGVTTAALFTRFMDSPENTPFTLESILARAGGAAPALNRETEQTDAVLNRERTEPAQRPNYNNY